MAPPQIIPTYLSLLSLFYLFHSSLALQVTPGSPCAAQCMDHEDNNPYSPDSSTTNATDIVCQDSLYSSTDEGSKFKSCIECLQKSGKTNGTEADNYWLLYNLRYSLGTCLYGFDDEDKIINSPCIINWACEPLEEAILAGGLDPDGDDTFGYCSAGNGSLFGETLRSCINCLKSSDDETYLGNCKFSPLPLERGKPLANTVPVMVALQVGCRQEPDPGVPLGISGSMFTRENLEVTIGSDEENDDPGASPNSLTTGAIVGIAVGAALLVFGGAALWFVYRRKKKNSGTSSPSWGGGRRNEGPPPNSPSRFPMISGPRKPWIGGEARSAASSRASERSEDEKGGGGAGTKITGGRVNELRGYGNAQHGRTGSLSSIPAHPAYIPSRGEHGRSDSLSSLPTHPAYIPRAASRSNTPTPPPPGRNPFDSRSGSSLSSRTSTPPRGPSPSGSPPRRPARAAAATEFVVPPPPEPKQTAAPDFILAPPPARAKKVPSVAVPSPQGQGRTPKKYTPPTIIIDSPAETRGPKFVKVTA